MESPSLVASGTTTQQMVVLVVVVVVVYRGWGRPVSDSFEFSRIHRNLPFFDNHSQIFNLCLLNLHLVGFRNKSLSCNRARTFFVYSVKVILSGAKIKMSSMYTIIMHSLIISPKMSSLLP